jgi:hypothetical protein
MMRTIGFGATRDGAPVLTAMRKLGELLAAKPSKLSATWLDARQVDHDLITGAWKRLVYPDGRPSETLDRAAYTMRLLERCVRYTRWCPSN